MKNWNQWIINRIEELGNHIAYVKDGEMRDYTSFRIGGKVPLILFPQTEDDVRRVLQWAKACRIPFFIEGKGTNLLFTDEDRDLLVIRMTDFSTATFLENEQVYADAGIALNQLAVRAYHQSLSGLEFAHGIPGTLGGACRMNAGAYEHSMNEIVKEVVALDLTEEGFPQITIPVKDCAFAYRQSVFASDRYLILGAKLQLSQGKKEEIRAQMDSLMARRKNSQPLEYPSAGSTFKRPVGFYAGTLIDQTGLKGLRVGGAEVSEKHAGFVINADHATCRDVQCLMKEIQKRVFEKHGVMLEPEVLFVE